MTGHYRIYTSAPIAKPGWSKRLYPLAEAVTYLGIVLLILGIGAACSVRG